jgi:cytochrome bd-type quinol oxidase subunit 2
MLKPLLWLVALAFFAFSLWVMLQIGYLGILQGGFANLGSTQISFDLVIACTVAVGFIARDCRAQGRAWWPWALLTLAAGSIGLLAYLLWPRR